MFPIKIGVRDVVKFMTDLEEQNCSFLNEVQRKEYELVNIEADMVSMQKKEVMQKLKTTNIAIRKMQRRRDEILAKNKMMQEATKP